MYLCMTVSVTHHTARIIQEGKGLDKEVRKKESTSALND